MKKLPRDEIDSLAILSIESWRFFITSASFLKIENILIKWFCKQPVDRWKDSNLDWNKIYSKNIWKFKLDISVNFSLFEKLAKKLWESNFD